MKNCKNCGTKLPPDNLERYFDDYCFDCFHLLFLRGKPKMREVNYHLGIKTMKEYMNKDDIIKYYKDKINEEGDKLGSLYEAKKNFLKTDGNPDWFIELGLELLNERISKVQKNIKKLVFKYDVVTGVRQEYNKKVDLDAIKAIPITDILTIEPKMKAPNRLFYLAPWRNETIPSLVVYIDSNRWYDFGEAIGGSVIDLYMKLNSIDFKDAVRELSNQIIC